MHSCAGSCCTCSPKASYVSATSVSWPTGGAPPSCRYAFTCSARHKNRKPNKTPPPPMTPTISGAAPSVVERWWSSNGSHLPESNFVLHQRSPLLHETTLYDSRSFARFGVLRPSALCHRTNPFFHLPQLPSWRYFSAVASSRVPGVICRALPHSLGPPRHRSFPRLNLHRPASAATTGGFLLTALSNARRAPCHLHCLVKTRVR